MERLWGRGPLQRKRQSDQSAIIRRNWKRPRGFPWLPFLVKACPQRCPERLENSTDSPAMSTILASTRSLKTNSR